MSGELTSRIEEILTAGVQGEYSGQPLSRIESILLNSIINNLETSFAEIEQTVDGLEKALNDLKNQLESSPEIIFNNGYWIEDIIPDSNNVPVLDSDNNALRSLCRINTV